jgi:hypothetical protein
MDELKYEKLTEVSGHLEAELIESYLEAYGIDVELVGESIARSSYVVTVDGLGLVQIFVPKDKMDEARELMKAYEEGAPGTSDDDSEQAA